MNKPYNHLTLEEREIISQLYSQGKSLGEISKALGRPKSTVSRELKRNFSNFKNKYFAHLANNQYHKRKVGVLKHKRLRSSLIRAYVIEKIKLGWSPEQIAGRLKLDHPGCSVSHEAIYQFIYDPFIRSRFDLVPDLRRNHKKRFKKSEVRKSKKTTIPNRIPIEERSQEINERQILGHWEGDSIISRKSKAALNTIVERKSNFVLISKLNAKTAEETKNAIVMRLCNLPQYLRQTLTLDNGCENAHHEKITKEIDIKCYFANPYHSWERAINENTNGLVRWYLPKGTDFQEVSEEDVKKIEWLLNTRPRKRLNYRTPLEVFTEGHIA